MKVLIMGGRGWQILCKSVFDKLPTILFSVEQITLPDHASCLSVKTFLHMCGLKYIEELRTNAEEMSPSGRYNYVISPHLVVFPFFYFIDEWSSFVVFNESINHIKLPRLIYTYKITIVGDSYQIDMYMSCNLICWKTDAVFNLMSAQGTKLIRRKISGALTVCDINFFKHKSERLKVEFIQCNM